jgi:hypothetical protein
MRYGRESILPDPDETAVYDTVFETVYRRLYPAVAPLSRAISDLQAGPASSSESNG